MPVHPKAPLTTAEERAIKIKEESSALKKTTNDLFNQQREQATKDAWEGYKANSQAAWKNYLAKLDRECLGKDRSSGKEIPQWDLVQQTIDNTTLEQHSYNNWQSAMMEILKMCTILNRAIGTSLTRAIAKNAIVSALGSRLWTVSDIKDILIEKVCRNNPNFELPTLVHNLKMDESNKINYAPLKGFNEGLEKNKLDRSFETLVALWLAENHGYEPSATKAGVFIKRDAPQEELTSTLFEQFKKDDLDEFLKKNTDLEFRPSGPN